MGFCAPSSLPKECVCVCGVCLCMRWSLDSHQPSGLEKSNEENEENEGWSSGSNTLK